MAKKTAKKSTTKSSTKESQTDVSKDEQIGFHKGSLLTLTKERQELARMLNIVEQLMQMHSTALQELGVELDVQQQQTAAPVKKKPPIEDIL